MAEATVFVEQSSPAAILRQLVLMVGIAASVALGAYVVMWARTPHFAMLYSDLSDRDLTQVADALKAAQIPYQVEAGAGSILVDAEQLDDARMKLAAAGLPKGGARGFEMFDDPQSFGTSQFLEHARYQHAIEDELSRSIARIDNVRAARVHLAVPTESVFARQRRTPSASVILDLYAGRSLGADQVAAVTHLVSASVPNLTPERVTIVDSRGNLLTAKGQDQGMAVTAQRFDYSRRLEQAYTDRIEAILTPLVGVDGVRAQVNADLDFTVSEQTRESFNPDLPAVRSERLLEEEREGGGPGGVPGALSNTPPLAATAPEQAPTEGAAPIPAKPVTEEIKTPTNRRTQTTRNYELDRTISHTKPSVGSIRRLSVAVVVRNPAGAAAAEKGKKKAKKATALSEEQLGRMTQLVKEAIGFDEARGDTVNVTAADFLAAPTPEPLPAEPMWKQPWVWNVGKQAVGGLFVLFLVFGVLKPTIKSMLVKPAANPMLAGPATGAAALTGPGVNDALRALPGAGGSLSTPGGPHENLDQVKQIVAQDPRVAAQVIKGWVGE